MKGEMDFAESLAERVMLLKGAPASLLEQVKGVIHFRRGAEETCRALKKLGCTIGRRW